MKSFHTTQKLSCIILGMGMMVSAHAGHVSCGDTIAVDTTLDGDLFCGAGAFALRITGDDITLDLGTHSINFVAGGPGTGILITGDNNEVKGPGTVSEFIDNVAIEDGNDNRVSKLNIDGGTTGVVIRTIFGPQANGNHISDNVISDMAFAGIRLRAFNVVGADVSGNHVHHNDIKDISVGGTAKIGIFIDSDDVDASTNDNRIYRNHLENISASASSAFGIFLLSADAGSIAENNRVVNNTIKGVSGAGAGSVADGIFIDSFDTSSTSLNTIAFNKIEDTSRYGIQIRASGALSVAEQNTVFLNHITRPGAEAIALRPFGLGSVFVNSVTWNFARDVPGQAYCDSSGVFNNWGINTDDLLPLIFAPGPC